MFRNLPVWILLLPLLTSCIKEDPRDDVRKHFYEPNKGLFIINEGNFGYGNSSLSYLDLGAGKMYNNVVFNTNGVPLGDVALSMAIRGDTGYVVVNNSGKIQMINTTTFELIGSIKGLTSPRFIHLVSGIKAYVTDLYTTSIAIVNPVTGKIDGSIDVSNPASEFFQHTTEQMVQYDKYVFVNCWSFDNKILVIDAELDEVVDSIEVLKQPNSMALDRNGALWVLTDGGYEGSPYGYEAPGLMKVDAGTRNARVVHRFREGEYPTNLVINGTGDTLFYLNHHVYSLPVGTGEGPVRFIESPYDPSGFGGYYGLVVDPYSSEVYVADAIDFVQRGYVFRFSPSGVPLDTLQAGINPGGFCFKP